MSSKNLSRRLERLEAELAPAGPPEVLTITVTRIGAPGEVREFRIELNDRRLRPWQRNRDHRT